MIQKATPSILLKSKPSLKNIIPMGISIIARKIFATKDPTLMFQPALYAIRYPNSRPIIETPSTTLVQFNSLKDCNRLLSVL